MSRSQWVNIGCSKGVSNDFPDANLVIKSARGSPTQAGTSTTASTLRVKASCDSRKRLMASRKTSMPLLRNSYLPLVETMKVLSSKVLPIKALATSMIRFLASLRLLVSSCPRGTKLSSKPLSNISSTGLSSSSLHSLAVISLTVVKQST